MSRPTIDQKRATHVLGRFRGHEARYPDNRNGEQAFWNEYAGAAQGFPAQIRMQGLILALGTEIVRACKETNDAGKIRGEGGRFALLDDLADWLGEWSRTVGLDAWDARTWPKEAAPSERRARCRLARIEHVRDLLIQEREQQRYVTSHGETLAWLGWVKTLSAPRRSKNRGDGGSGSQEQPESGSA